MIDYHRRILTDNVRNQAFHDALKSVIHPGETTVSDIGAGTGFMSFLASMLGAKECHLYEYGEIATVAKELAELNNIGNLHFVNKHSSTVKKPVKTDIVLSETLGNFALEEHIIENLEDGKRFLKPDGIIIPGKITQFVAPVISPRVWKEVTLWDSIGFDLDFSSAKEVSLNNIYVRSIAPVELLNTDDAVQIWDRIDFSQDVSSRRKGTITWTFPNPTPNPLPPIYGFAAWWEAELVPGVHLSTNPSAPPTHWEQIFFPVPGPLNIQRGDELHLTIASDTRRTVGLNLTWDVAQKRNGKVIAKSEMDMKRGFIN